MEVQYIKTYEVQQKQFIVLNTYVKKQDKSQIT